MGDTETRTTQHRDRGQGGLGFTKTISYVFSSFCLRRLSVLLNNNLGTLHILQLQLIKSLIDIFLERFEFLFLRRPI